jgi:hypothetical protein
MYQEGYSQPFLGKGCDSIEGFHNFLSNAAKVAVNQPLG